MRHFILIQRFVAHCFYLLGSPKNNYIRFKGRRKKEGSNRNCNTNIEIGDVRVRVCVCTFSGEGWRAVLDSVELQQQPVQLGQVAAQRRVHGDGRRLAALLLIRETAGSERTIFSGGSV